MAQQTIVTIPTVPANSGTGTPIANSFLICNENFTELYARAQTSPPVTLVGQVGDEAGMYAYDSTYFYYCFANYDGSSTIWAQVTQVGNIAVSSLTNGTSNLAVGLNSNVTVGVAGTNNVVIITNTGEFVTGVVSASGNVTGDYILGNGSQLTGLPQTYANANVADYLPTYSGDISANNITITTELSSGIVSASGNISGGNIRTPGLISSTGNITTQGIISATGNIVTAGYFVGTFVGNVTGNFVVPGSNTQVLYNTNGNADASAGFTFDTNGPNLLTVLGTISSQGNVVAGNITTAGLITATGNITGGNIDTAGVVSATGNVRGGNFNTAGLITATGNITGGNISTAGLITATGNIQGGNIRTAGIVTATGNISGSYLRAINDLDIGGNATATGYTGASISVLGNVTGGNVLTAGLISATGNVTGNYFVGNGSQLTGIDATQIQNGNSNVKIDSAGGNVTVSVNGVGPVITFASNGEFVVGDVSASGNVIGGGNINTVGLITATGNITGGNILTAGLISATGTVTSADNVTGGNITTAGVVTATGNITGGNILTAGLISATGNITGGNLTVDTVTVGNIVNSNANGVGNIGSSTTYFDTVFATATSAQYADLAENYLADKEYQPGTVVIFGGDKEITISTESADERVAGAISTNPAHLMNAGEPGLAVALRGRVPVRVTGPVVKGDSLITSSIPGVAQSVGRDRSYAQAVFAKAIETDDSPGEKTITAVIL